VIAVVEHENNPYSAHSEIYKLTRFAAPLRVLITYPADGVLAKRLLREYTDLIHGAVAAANYASGACLVILGLPRRWEAYIYDGRSQEFVDLPPLKIPRNAPIVGLPKGDLEAAISEIEGSLNALRGRASRRPAAVDSAIPRGVVE